MTKNLIENQTTINEDKNLYAVDWLKVEVNVNHNRDSINDGLIAYCAKNDYDNPTLSYKKMKVGSFNTHLEIKSVADNKLIIQNNFGKWLNGQNIIGSTNINKLVHDVVVKLSESYDINPTEEQLEAILEGCFKIYLIDINRGILFDTKEQALTYLERIKLNGSYPKRQKYIKRNTVYFGLGSDRKEIKYYHKGKEIVANKHYQACLTEELKALADRMVRLEIRLKPIELNELRLQHGYDWDDDTIQYILDKDYARLNLPKPVCELELPKNYLKFLSCYKSGTLIDCYKSSSIKRMKRDMIRLYGIELDNMA